MNIFRNGMRAIGRIRIGVRMVAGFGIVVALSVVLGAFSLTSSSKLASLTENLFEGPYKVSSGLSGATENALRIQIGMQQSLMAAGEHEVTEVDERVKGFRDALNASLVEVEAAYQGDKSALTNILATVKTMEVKHTKLFDLLRTGQFGDGELMMIGNPDNKYYGANLEQNELGILGRLEADLFKGLTGLNQEANATAQEFMLGTEETSASTMILLLALTGIVTCVGFVVSSVVTVSITYPLSQVQKDMECLSNGESDFEVSGVERRDEVGVMAQSVLIFQQNAVEMERLQAGAKQTSEQAERRRQEVMEHVSTFEKQVKAVAEQLTGASGDVTQGSETMTELSGSSREIADQMSVSIRDAAANVAEAASAAEEMSASIQEINSQVDSSARLTKNAVSQAQDARGVMEELSHKAAAIDGVLNMIREIADQTNLLALNATIEAARAGDAGRGFAVVAHEVKELAEQSAKAAGEIGTQIADVQQGVAATAKAIEEIGGIIHEVDTSTEAIGGAVQAQGAATGQISESMQMADTRTSSVLSEITKVVEAMEATENSSGALRSAAEGVLSQSGSLRQNVDDFTAKLSVTG